MSNPKAGDRVRITGKGRSNIGLEGTLVSFDGGPNDAWRVEFQEGEYREGFYSAAEFEALEPELSAMCVCRSAEKARE